jgi:adenosylcobinamide kinase / adenosylcobinamide-phosphate guanylyltransferase
LNAGMLTLITGGSRGGKSARAITLASAHPGTRKFFIATAEPLDDEMRRRVELHQRARPVDFHTVEEPRWLTAIVESLIGNADLIIIDCLTIWIANLMGDGLSDDAILAEATDLAALLGKLGFPAIVVTDEVGWGVVPEYPAGRRFRDLLGWSNQAMARAADEVWLMVAGCPLRLK